MDQLFAADGDVTDVGATVKVPTDDYRAIRRAILDLAEFENRDKPAVPERETNPS